MKDFDEFLKTLDSEEMIDSLEKIYTGVTNDPELQYKNSGVPNGDVMALSYFVTLRVLRKYHDWYLEAE